MHGGENTALLVSGGRLELITMQNIPMSAHELNTCSFVHQHHVSSDFGLFCLSWLYIELRTHINHYHCLVCAYLIMHIMPMQCI